jgi:hypothetical protein
MKRKSIKKIQINKKTIIVFLILLSIFIIFIYSINKPRSYKSTYKINKYIVEEKYNKEDTSYIFNITVNKVTYTYKFNYIYQRKRHLIDKITVNTDKESTCILPTSTYIDFYPICYKDSYISLNLTNNDINYKYMKVNNKSKTYKKIKIYNLYNKNYLVYNYTGFLFIGNNNKNILLDTNNEYSLDNLYKTDNYLIIPLVEDYYIKEFVLINGINSKVYKISNDMDISNDISYLGKYKNNIYFIDYKEEKEYLINIKKKKIKELDDGVIIKNNKLVDMDIEDILKMKESSNTKDSFILEDNILYKVNDNIKIKVTDKVIDKIISISYNEVYYISNGILYVYNMYDGEIKLLENFEWNFNMDNQIFIFNK